MKYLAIVYLILMVAIAGFLAYATYRAIMEKNKIATALYIGCMVPFVYFIINLLSGQ